MGVVYCRIATSCHFPVLGGFRWVKGLSTWVAKPDMGDLCLACCASTSVRFSGKSMLQCLLASVTSVSDSCLPIKLHTQIGSPRTSIKTRLPRLRPRLRSARDPTDRWMRIESRLVRAESRRPSSNNYQHLPTNLSMEGWEGPCCKFQLVTCFYSSNN